MVNWEIWKMLKELVIEIGLIICVNSGTLHNSPLHRILEVKWNGIERNRSLRMLRKWDVEDLKDY